MIANLCSNGFKLLPRFFEIVHFKDRNSQGKARFEDQPGVEIQCGAEFVCGSGIVFLLQGFVAFAEMDVRGVRGSRSLLAVDPLGAHGKQRDKPDQHHDRRLRIRNLHGLAGAACRAIDHYRQGQTFVRHLSSGLDGLRGGC